MKTEPWVRLHLLSTGSVPCAPFAEVLHAFLSFLSVFQFAVHLLSGVFLLHRLSWHSLDAHLVRKR